MATKKNQRVRLTDVSIADIGVAERLILEPSPSGGWMAKAKNQYGEEYLRDGTGVAVYDTKASITKTAKRHNPKIVVDTHVSPSPSLLPKS